MCSLVEIKTPDEIYIHYTGRDLGKESTSDRGDSIDSGDTVTTALIEVHRVDGSKNL